MNKSAHFIAQFIATCYQGKTEPVARILGKARPAQLKPLLRGVDASTKRNALHHAAVNGHTDIVKLLLKSSAVVGADVNLDLQDIRGWTALHCAVSGGHIDTIKALIQGGLNVNIADKQQKSPLLLAVIEGSLPMVEILISADAKFDIADIDGNTAMHLAAQYGHESVVEHLIVQGAEYAPVNNENSTPAMIARNFNHVKIALLIEELEQLGLVPTEPVVQFDPAPLLTRTGDFFNSVLATHERIVYLTMKSSTENQELISIDHEISFLTNQISHLQHRLSSLQNRKNQILSAGSTTQQLLTDLTSSHLEALAVGYDPVIFPVIEKLTGTKIPSRDPVVVLENYPALSQVYDDSTLGLTSGRSTTSQNSRQQMLNKPSQIQIDISEGSIKQVSHNSSSSEPGTGENSPDISELNTSFTGSVHSTTNLSTTHSSNFALDEEILDRSAQLELGLVHGTGTPSSSNDHAHSNPDIALSPRAIASKHFQNVSEHQGQHKRTTSSENEGYRHKTSEIHDSHKISHTGDISKIGKSFRNALAMKKKKKRRDVPDMKPLEINEWEVDQNSPLSVRDRASIFTGGQQPKFPKRKG